MVHRSLRAIGLIALCLAWLGARFTRANAAELHGKVLVFPFTVVGDTTTSNWIGQAMQQSMLDSLARNRAVQAVSVAAPPKDDADAIAQARQAGADFYIAGDVQRVSDSLRVIAAVNDSQGNRVHPLAARGQLHDLFLMEDAIEGQLASLRPAPARAAGASSATPQYPTSGAPLSIRQPTYGDGTELAEAIANGPANANDPRADAAYLRYADQYPYYCGWCGCWGYGCYGWRCGWGGWGCGYNGWNGRWSSPVANDLYAAPLPP